MNVYFLVYDEDIREEALLPFLDSRKEVLNWMTILPSSVLLVTRHSLRQLTRMLNRKYPDAQFLLAELKTAQADGMLPEECWDFINSPDE
jgi:hypothetical protein